MSNTTPCGLDGNIGFPYAFTGEMVNATLSEMQTPIRFSFGDMKTTPTLMRETSAVNINSSSSNTILYNGTKYELGYTQLCQPHSLWSLKNSNIVAEIIFTFITKNKSTINPLIVTLSYLIEKSAKGDDKNEFLNCMFSNMPPTKNINIMDLCSTSPSHFLYYSCIPYLEKGKNIGGMRAMCIVGERAIKVNSELLKQLNLRKFRLPSTLLLTNDRQTIISYSIKAAGMSNPVVSTTGETFTNSIDTNSDAFKNRFKVFNFVKKARTTSSKTRAEGFMGDFITHKPRFGEGQTEGFAGDLLSSKPRAGLIQPEGFVDASSMAQQEGGTEATESSDSITTKSVDYVKLDELKCYPISQQTDIKGDILLIDPATGKRMDKHLLEANASLKGPGEISVPEKSRTFVIVLGVLAGLLLAIIIVAILLQFVYKSGAKDVINATVKPGANAASVIAKDVTKEMLIPAAATTFLLATTQTK
jgi:hypothetical protein